MEEIDESWQHRYFREKSDKYVILAACIGIILFFIGIFNLFSSFNEIINIIINIVMCLIGFLIVFLMYVFYFRTRTL